MNKLGEVIRGKPSTEWAKLDNYQQYTCVADAGTASPLDSVTVQLRKATAAGGTNATNHGTAVTGFGFANASLRAEDLGEFSAGVPYTHVSAVVTDAASPNTVTSFGILSDPRYAEGQAGPTGFRGS